MFDEKSLINSTKNALFDKLLDSIDERFSSGKSDVLLVFQQAGETRAQAVDRVVEAAGCREPPRYMLLINIHRTEEPTDIERMIQAESAFSSGHKVTIESR